MFGDIYEDGYEDGYAAGRLFVLVCVVAALWMLVMWQIARTAMRAEDKAGKAHALADVAFDAAMHRPSQVTDEQPATDKGERDD